MTHRATIGGILAAAFLAATGFGSAGTVLAAEDILVSAVYDENGEAIYEQYIVGENPLLMKTLHYYRLAAMPNAEAPGNGNGGGNGGGGGGGGGGGTDPGTDCESDTYKLTGWHWTGEVNFVSADYASLIGSGGNAWDQATSASIFGGSSSGKQGEAGQLDGVNQVEWESLGASTTVAVTTTWSYRGSGEAVESDAQYNTYYPWSTNGASGTMDVLNVATHEIGHTFGLGHPNGGGISCLTMYAYVDYGQTSGRTLGDGDILGVRAIYG